MRGEGREGGDGGKGGEGGRKESNREGGRVTVGRESDVEGGRREKQREEGWESEDHSYDRE